WPTISSANAARWRQSADIWRSTRHFAKANRTSMRERLRKQIDDDDAGHDEAHANQRRHVQRLAEPQPADGGDEDDTGTAPQRIDDADRHAAQRQRQE